MVEIIKREGMAEEIVHEKMIHGVLEGFEGMSERGSKQIRVLSVRLLLSAWRDKMSLIYPRKNAVRVLLRVEPMV